MHCSANVGEKVDRHGARCWLINTGWGGGGPGVGARISIAYTRAMVNAALSGQLEGVPTHRDESFGLLVPTAEAPERGPPAGVLSGRLAAAGGRGRYSLPRPATVC